MELETQDLYLYALHDGDLIASFLGMIALFLALAVVGNDTASLGTLLLLLVAFFVAIFAAFLIKYA